MNTVMLIIIMVLLLIGDVWLGLICWLISDRMRMTEAPEADIANGGIDLTFFRSRAHKAVKPTDRASKWIQNHSTAAGEVR